MKDKIIGCDVKVPANVSPDSIYDGIRLENSYGNSEGFIVGTSEGKTMGLIDNTMLCVADSSKLENKLD